MYNTNAPPSASRVAQFYMVLVLLLLAVALPCFGRRGGRRPWRGLQWRVLQNCKDRESDTLSMASEIAKFLFEAQA